MEIFPTLYKNEKLKKTVALDILSGAASHAYIFEGPRGSGKHTAAYLCAASLLCENRGKAERLPCGVCPSCKKVLSGECTDVTFLGRDGAATIGVDAVRRSVKDSLWFAPNEMEYKIYIIEDADKMTAQAQNALLIPLEEAPSFAVFFLLCRDSLAILETVRSRAPIIRMEIFSNDATAEYLMRSRSIDAPAARAAAASSNGCIGQALEYLGDADGHDAKRRDAVSAVVRELCVGNAVSRIKAFESFPDSRAETAEWLGLVKTALRDLLCDKKSGDAEMFFYSDVNEARAVSSKVSVRRLCELWDALSGAEEDISANASVRSVLLLLCTR